MNKHKSFRISDFSLKDLPWAIAAYLAFSVIAIGLGLFLELLPNIWIGLLLMAGSALLVGFYLFLPAKKQIDVSTFPVPSDNVRAKCNDSTGSFIDAIKAYREETGLGLEEATAVLRDYQKKPSRGESVE